jgi:uncharacterized protein (DUF305 family)
MKRKPKKTSVSKDALVYGALGLTIGVLLMAGVSTWADRGAHHDTLQLLEMHTKKDRHWSAGEHSAMSMADMTDALKDKTGEAFDQAFIDMMIAHHQGAVDMANLIPAQAKHAEIKQLGQSIIAAQTKEIEAMKQWQKDWSYQGGMSHDMRAH